MSDQNITAGKRGYGRLYSLFLIPVLLFAAVMPLRTILAEAYLALADSDPDPAGPSRIRNLQAALGLFPGNAQYHDRLAEALMLAGDGKNAVDDYRRSVLIRPTWPYNRVGLASASMQANAESKIPDSVLIQASRLGPNERNLQLFLSWLQTSRGDRLSARGKAVTDGAIRFSMHYDRPRLLNLMIENGEEMPICEQYRVDKDFADWCSRRKQARDYCLTILNTPEGYQWCENLHVLPARPKL